MQQPLNTLQKLTAKLHSSTQLQAIMLVVVYMMLTGNLTLFRKLIALYPITVHNFGFLVSLAVFFTALTTLFLFVVSYGRAGRWLIAALLVLTAQAAYYMDNFGVLIDVVMIDNIMHTDAKEIAGLINVGLISRTCLLGLLPAWLVVRYWPKIEDTSKELRLRLKYIGLTILTVILVVIPFTAGYTSFIREHKITRFYANPTYPVYSLIKYAITQLSTPQPKTLKKIERDAHFFEKGVKNELIILVVGETARADRFSLNGYHRDTNPLLAKQEVISFSNVSSCGTSTGVSVPCMFSSLTREEYEKDKALAQENALDVISNHGVEVLWRDNNSDSKGVALRVKYENFQSPTLNPVCDKECRDIGMLGGLDQYIASKKGKDILIVLHQMGNHGPEYYRRYPKEFARFQPMCMTGELRDCTQEEIDNSYDNAILYTDYFLSETINFLKKYDNTHETAMLYVADHGESLGENGIYLHAAPYIIAPKEQTHIPAILWMGKNFDFKMQDILPYQHKALSHDNLFCTILTGFELTSKTCAPSQHAVLEKHEDLAE